MGKKQPACLLSPDGSEADNARARPPAHSKLRQPLPGPVPRDHSLLSLPQPSFSSKVLPPTPRYKRVLTPHIPKNHKSSWAATTRERPLHLLPTPIPTPTPYRPERVGLPLFFLEVTLDFKEEGEVRPG